MSIILPHGILDELKERHTKNLIFNRVKIIKDLCKELNRIIITYVLTDWWPLQGRVIMDETDIFPLYEVLKNITKKISQKTHHIALYIYTRGGNVFVPFRILKLIKEYDPNFEVIVPYRAHSAGTHLVLGASKIYMTKISELSAISGQLHIPIPQLHISIPFSYHDLESYRTHLNQMSHRINVISNPPISDQIWIGQSKNLYETMRKITIEILKDKFSDPKKIEKIVNTFMNREHQNYITIKDAKELGLPIVDVEKELEEKILNDILKLYLYYAQELMFDGYSLENSNFTGKPYLEEPHKLEPEPPPTLPKPTPPIKPPIKLPINFENRRVDIVPIGFIEAINPSSDNYYSYTKILKIYTEPYGQFLDVMWLDSEKVEYVRKGIL